jgi:hypothetical protein
MGVTNIKIQGTGRFTQSTKNFGEVDQGEFADTSSNNGVILSSATFLGTSTNTGSISGTASFSGSAVNTGVIQGSATFADFTVNTGSISSVTFTGNAINTGIVLGDATFADFTVNTGSISSVTFTGNAINTGIVLGDATFEGTSINTGTVSGNAFFYGDATNDGGSIAGTTYNFVTDPFFANNVILINGDGTNNQNNTVFLDSSTNVVTISNTSAMQGALSPYSPDGWSGYFNGSSFIRNTNINAFDFSSSSTHFTIEAWVYSLETGSTTRGIIAARGTAVTEGWCLYINGSTKKLSFGGVIVGSAYQDTAISNVIIPSNTWTHVAFVKDATGYTGYVNGLSGVRIANANGLSYVSSRSMIIGAVGYTSSAELPFNGYISNLRIVKGTALYSTTFTPSSSPLTNIPNTSLLTLQSNRFVDNSSNNIQFTVTGASIHPLDPFNPSASYNPTTHGGSAYFSGTNNIRFLSNSNFAFGTGNFTIDFWMNPTATPGASTPGIMFKIGGSTVYDVAVSLDSTLAITVNFWPIGASPTLRLASSANAAPLNTWTHIAVVRSGRGAGQTKLYINGIENGATTVGTAGTLNYNLTSTGFGFVGRGDEANRFYTGYISNVRVVKGTAVYSHGFDVPTSPLSAVANTSFLLKDPYPPTTPNITGTATLSSASPFGVGTDSSLSFNGSSNFLSVPANSNFNFTSSGSFTIEAWVRWNSGSLTSARYIITNYSNVSNGWALYSNASKLYFNASGDEADITGTTTLQPNIWYHVAVAGTPGSYKMFLNGVQEGATFTGATSFTGSTLYIGKIVASGTSYYYFSGAMSNIRIVNDIALYTSNFTVPTEPLSNIANTSLLLKDPYLTGTATLSSASPFGVGTDSSMSFNGSSEINTIGTSTDFNLNGVYTLEGWWYLTNTSGLKGLLSNMNNGAAGTLAGWILGYDSASGGSLYLYQYVSGSYIPSQSFVIAAGTLNTNQWYHIAISCDGTTVRTFLNGVRRNAASHVQSQTNNFRLTLGAWDFSVDRRRMSGFISNVRLIKGTSLYTNSFTPPTSPTTAISGTSLLLNFANGGIIDSSNKSVLTLVGDTKISTTQIKYGTGSMYFNGAGDYLSIPNNELFRFGTGEFTIEWWWYLTTPYTSTNGPGIGQKAGDANGGWVIYKDGNTPTAISLRLAGQGGASMANYNTTVTPSVSTWQHWAVVRSGTTVTWYQDGIACGTTTGVSTNVTDTNTTAPMYINYAQTWSYVGPACYIDDLRITKGIARYTTNFTPPSAAHLLR